MLVAVRSPQRPIRAALMMRLAPLGVTREAAILARTLAVQEPNLAQAAEVALAEVTRAPVGSVAVGGIVTKVQRLTALASLVAILPRHRSAKRWQRAMSHCGPLAT